MKLNLQTWVYQHHVRLYAAHKQHKTERHVCCARRFTLLIFRMMTCKPEMEGEGGGRGEGSGGQGGPGGAGVRVYLFRVYLFIF